MQPPQIAISAKAADSVENILEMTVEAGFSGIDWSFHPRDFIDTDIYERWLSAFRRRHATIEIRYHTPWGELEIGHRDPGIAGRAMELLTESLPVLERLDADYMTVHIGLHKDGDQGLDAKIARDNLARLVEVANRFGITICLENLKNGLTSRPKDFVEIIRASGAMVTFDIGHALSSTAHRDDWPCPRFIEAVSSSIVNAHIYEAETDRHIAPQDLSVIGMPLAKLLQATTCNWWVIELSETREIFHTRRLLEQLMSSDNPNVQIAGIRKSAKEQQ